jgi:hypothetical protein
MTESESNGLTPQRKPFPPNENWMPISRRILDRINDHRTVRSGLGKLSPAVCREAGMTDKEEQAIEALYGLLEADDFYVPVDEEGEPVAWLRSLDGTDSYHPCAEGDPGSFPVYL